jgi:hypothetical protein
MGSGSSKRVLTAASVRARASSRVSSAFVSRVQPSMRLSGAPHDRPRFALDPCGSSARTLGATRANLTRTPPEFRQQAQRVRKSLRRPTLQPSGGRAACSLRWTGIQTSTLERGKRAFPLGLRTARLRGERQHGLRPDRNAAGQAYSSASWLCRSLSFARRTPGRRTRAVEDLIGLRLPDPLPKRFLVDAQVSGDMRDRPTSTRTPAAPLARATHRGTSSVSPSLEHLLPPGQRLAPEPPRFPGSFI